MRGRLHLMFRALLLMMMLNCGLSAYASNSKVSIDVDGIALENVLKSIERQTKYRFIYSKETVNVNVPVTLKVKDEALTSVLDKLFATHGISYVIDKKQIVLNSRSTKVNKQDSASKGNKIKVSGIVSDPSGEPLIGASVRSDVSAVGVSTDIDGRYEIEVPAGSNILFSYVGYCSEKKKAEKSGVLDVTLTEDSQLLSEVVVIGYGTMDKKELTSAITHVSAKDFQSVAASDVSMLIQGKVPGLSVTNTAQGDPNSSASLQIRGVSSRSAGLGPLIVLDGVPGADLSNINPNDIASFDVLKDGAASAIYGTRGSNGVIIVTTKKGERDGNVHTTYNGQFSWDKANRDLDMMSASDFRRLRIADGDDVDLGGNEDWFGLVSQVGFRQSHTISISGGNERSNYRGSVDYRKGEGIERRGDREEYGARVVLNHMTKGGLLDINLNVAPRIVHMNLADHDVFRRAIEANPTTPLFDPNHPDRYYDFTGSINNSNPVEAMNLIENKQELRIIDWSGTAKLNLLPLLAKDVAYGQTLSTQVTFANHNASSNISTFSPSTLTSNIRNGIKGSAHRSTGNSRDLSFEWLANYSAYFNGHNLKAMLGYSYQYWHNDGHSSSNYDFANDGIGADNIGSGEGAKTEGVVNMDSYRDDAKLISFFGRLSYDWKGRYLATVSLRHEGSSKFGANHKWGNFPAFSLGWRISEESFMDGTRAWLNDLKIRGDYGVTGNQNFASYLSLDTMSPYGYTMYNGQWIQTWGPNKNVNPDLHWEKGKNWNIGLDFAVWNNRVYGSLNYFSRRQQDLLGNYTVPVPPYVFDQTFVNVGTMKNSGFEFDINIDAVRTRDFTYSLNIIGATQKNTFVDFSNSKFVGEDYYNVAYTENPYASFYLQRIEKGHSVGSFFMFRYAGVSEDGQWLIYDKDGDIIRATQGRDEDRAYVGNGLPKFTLSTGHNFRYRNFDLSLFFRGAFGFDIFNIHDFYYGTRNFQGANLLNKAYGKNLPVSSTASQIVTDYFLERGDYFKLDNLTLGYTLKTPKIPYLDGFRIYGTVRNVFTITKFSGMDPSNYQVNGLTPSATGSRSYYPTTRQFILGVQLDF